MYTKVWHSRTVPFEPEVNGPLLITRWLGVTTEPARSAQVAAAPVFTKNDPFALTPAAQVSDPHPLTRSSVAFGNATALFAPTLMVPLVRNVVPVNVRLLGFRSSQLMNTLAWLTVSGAFIVHDAPAKSSGKTV